MFKINVFPFRSLTCDSFKVEHRRLPLQEHVANLQTHIVNIDVIVSILAKYVVYQDWKRAIAESLPLRISERGGKKRRRLEKKDGSSLAPNSNSSICHNIET
jgi:hypothetical protein